MLKVPIRDVGNPLFPSGMPKPLAQPFHISASHLHSFTTFVRSSLLSFWLRRVPLVPQTSNPRQSIDAHASSQIFRICAAMRWWMGYSRGMVCGFHSIWSLPSRQYVRSSAFYATRREGLPAQSIADTNTNFRLFMRVVWCSQLAASPITNSFVQRSQLRRYWGFPRLLSASVQPVFVWSPTRRSKLGPEPRQPLPETLY